MKRVLMSRFIDQHPPVNILGPFLRAAG